LYTSNEQTLTAASTVQDMAAQTPGQAVIPMDQDIGGDRIGMGDDVSGEEDTMPAFDQNSEPNGIDMTGEEEPVENDVVVDTDDMGPEIGNDVDTDEARYSHNYSFRNNGTGLFQSLTGQQRIKKGALRTARRRLGN
jgi:hypothetical protein